MRAEDSPANDKQGIEEGRPYQSLLFEVKPKRK
jgi:hypothetical protein